MEYIKIRSSMALDALCFIDQRSHYGEEWIGERVNGQIKYINDRLTADFNNSYIGMSALCMLISASCDSDLEMLTLDGLIDIFKDIERMNKHINEKITDDHTRSYIYKILKMLKDGLADVYVSNLSILKNIGFEKIYNERIMPSVLEEIERKQNEVNAYNAEELFKNVSILKNCTVADQAQIFVSFFSIGLSFSLYGASFLTCFLPIREIDFYSLIAHELMHGFASDELTGLYKIHCQSTEYLKECYRALIEDYHSGNEEEFVMGAEYYLCYLSGRYTKEQIVLRAKNRYGGNCPTALAIFETLCEESEPPKDYNGWLISKFKDGTIGRYVA